MGFTARKKGVMLMFWNGQHFDEPELEASGSFHMAQKPYDDVAEIDEAKLARWLAKAGKSVWDMVGERNAYVAKQKARREARKPEARKPKTAAKTKPKRAARPTNRPPAKKAPGKKGKARK